MSLKLGKFHISSEILIHGFHPHCCPEHIRQFRRNTTGLWYNTLDYHCIIAGGKKINPIHKGKEIFQEENYPETAFVGYFECGFSFLSCILSERPHLFCFFNSSRYSNRNKARYIVDRLQRQGRILLQKFNNSDIPLGNNVCLKTGSWTFFQCLIVFNRYHFHHTFIFLCGPVSGWSHKPNREIQWCKSHHGKAEPGFDGKVENISR